MRSLKEAFRDESNEESVRELYYYIKNDGDLYRNFRKRFEANLLKKIRKGKYDSKKAIKLWMYLADAGAKKYKKEMLHRTDRTEWFELFNKATRHEVAKKLRDDFEVSVEEGAFDEPVNESVNERYSFSSFAYGDDEGSSDPKNYPEEIQKLLFDTSSLLSNTLGPENDEAIENLIEVYKFLKKQGHEDHLEKIKDALNVLSKRKKLHLLVWNEK